ncbi:hypothetical protein AHF37_01641 [Paragonimus kellicotti]|nr:hypothetical protein AHF37_01641 [Paragonimus kellicotti]
MEVLVEYDYTAEEPDELTIKKNEIIRDVSQFEEGWFIGNLNGKIGVFPDNFVKVGYSVLILIFFHQDTRKWTKTCKIGNISMQSSALISPTSTQGTYDAPKVAAKPVFNVSNAAWRHAHRDYPKVSVANTPGRVSSTSNALSAGQVGGDQTAGLPNASRVNKWRTNTDTLDRPKSRTDESHTITSGDSKDSVDSTSQQLNALTADRPKQTGRRLPSKFTRPSTPTSDRERQNSTSKSQRIPIAGQAKNGSLQRSEGMNGSVDLVRPSESAGTKGLAPDTPRTTQTQHAHHHFVSKPQTQSLDQLQSQHTQYVNEARQQFRDMQRQINQLNDANAQLRKDMMHGHRVFTERLQTLMNEIDEVKKQRAADVVEITRLRSLLMQLDAKAILTSSESMSVRNQIQTSAAKPRPHSGDRVDEPTAQLPDDAQSIYDEDEDSADHFKRMIGDNHNGTFLNKNADFTLNNIHGKVGISRATPALQPRPSQPSSYTKT